MLGSYCGTMIHFLSFCKNLTEYVMDSSPKNENIDSYGFKFFLFFFS